MKILTEWLKMAYMALSVQVRGGGERMATMAEGVMRYCARKVGYAAGFDVEIYKEHDERVKQARKDAGETLRRNFRYPGGRPRVRGQARRCKDVIAANKEKRMLRVNNSMTRSGELFDISEVRYRY